MMRFALALALLVGCDEGGGATFESTASTSAPKTGSSTGMSADLAKTVSNDGSGKTEPAGSGAEGKTEPAGSGAAEPKTEGKTEPKTEGKTDPKTEPKTEGKTDPKTEPKTEPKGDGPEVKPEAGNAPATADAQRAPVKVSADMAAIKLSLSPNWDRDVGEGGTISLVVKVPNSDARRVFSFQYGYEDAKAPADRDAYKKWLTDNKILVPTTPDRQRSGLWYLEGVDAKGAPIFRYSVVYGGRRLICGGSLYKDPISNQLGDIRDKTVIQAKEICESIAL